MSNQFTGFRLYCDRRRRCRISVIRVSVSGRNGRQHRHLRPINKLDYVGFPSS